MKKIFTYGLPFFILASIFFACKDEKQANLQPFDPSKPVTVSGFMPDSGGIRTRFIVHGDNFGNEKSKVKVFFNEKEAVVLGVKNSVIYAQVPKQPGDSSTIKVVVDKSEGRFDTKKFVYIIASNVSTIVGKKGEPGGKNGSIAETTFDKPRYVSVDFEDNLFVTESNGRFRVVSQRDNKSITAHNGILLGQATMTADRKKLYSLGDGNQTLYLFDQETGWATEPMGKAFTSGYVHSIAFGADSTFFYSRINTGDFIRFPNLGRKGLNPKLMHKFTGRIGRGSGGQNGHLVYNPVDGYFYCSTHNDHVIYRIKVNGDEAAIEEYSGSSGQGYSDGPLAGAQFNFPRGMAVDSEGNVIVADQNNHCIRKIDVKLGLVTTIAGQPRKAGYQDGFPEVALFNNPWGVACDKEDFIYIADVENHCIRKISVE